MKKTKRSKQNRLHDIGFYLSIAFDILCIVFLVQIYMLNILPMKFLLPLSLILILFIFGLSYLQLSRRMNKANKILGRILIVLLSLLLGVGNWYLFKTGSAFGKMTGDNSQTSIVSVVVMKDSSVKKINELTNQNIGYSKTSNQSLLNKAISQLEDDLSNNITISAYDAYQQLSNDLYDKKIDAILIDEATRGMFEDERESFSTETRVIKTYEYKTETKDISKNVDVTSKPFNVYISGIDTYGSIATVSRSDVNMMASINPTTRQILLISIPRDYYVPQTCQSNQKDKLTHTGIYGVNCTVSTVEKYFDIDINYYVRVNFSSVVDIVDALGGITVDNPQAFEATDENFYYPQGTIEMNGAKALRFARERYSFSGGDRDRGKNQMRVITGIINKAISPKIITNYTGIMDAIGGSFQTNMSNGEMTSLIKMQLGDMSGWSISQYAVDGTGETNWSPANGFNSYVMQPDMTTVNKAIELITKIHNGEDITGQI